jgi:glycosyltransferase involved in cell wall biosynthesis
MIVVVIPAYNESTRVAAAVIDAARFSDHVLVIDDCSTDETAHVAKTAGATVLRHVVNRGQGAALQTGMDFALQTLGAHVVVHFDADGQMRGDEIPMMVKPIVDGDADVVLGSRFLGSPAKDMPVIRKILVRLGTVFTMALSGIRVTDTHNGFRAFSRKAAGDIRISLDRMAHASEIIDLVKTKRFRFVERPVTITYSAETLRKGQSTIKALLTAKDILKKKVVG